MAANKVSLINRLLLILPRPLTADEKREAAALKELRKVERAQRAQLELEANAYEATIAKTLADLNICYRYANTEKDSWKPRVKMIRFKKYRVLTSKAIYLSVDLGPGARPRGVGIEHLKDSDVLVNLSANVGRKVDYLCRDDIGFVYVIYRQAGLRAIPAHVKYDDVLALRPPSADALSAPIGMAAGDRVIYRSASQYVSMLVAGTIGGGKSNFLRALLATLVIQNSPRRLRIALIDLKRGVEFSAFSALPHLIHFKYKDDDLPAMIDKREEVLPFLEWLINEGEARLDQLREAGVVKIGQYNHKHPNRALAHILLVIDEWADIKLLPKVGPAAQEALVNVASRFRAAGISVICCTQYPNKEVLSVRLKTVLPAKLCFSVPNMPASVIVLNSARAYGLDNAGRAIWQFGREEFELQVPYIGEQTVTEVVQRAVAGTHYKVEVSAMGRCDVSDEEIFEWAVAYNAGKLDVLSVYGQFRGRGLSKHMAEVFPRKYMGQAVVVGSSLYKIERPTNIGQPWTMVPVVEDDNPATPDQADTPDRPASTVIKASEFIPDAAQLAEVSTDEEAVDQGDVETEQSLSQSEPVDDTGDYDTEPEAEDEHA